MIKRQIIPLMLVISLILTSLYAMAKSMDQKLVMTETKETTALASVPGKIIFQSNREDGLSEIWFLENGSLKKIESSQSTDKNVAKEVPIIFKSELAGMSRPKWSPDGSKVLCVGNGELIVLSLHGEILEKIKPQKEPQTAVWSPTGESIYYKSVDFLQSGGGSANIFRFNLSDKSVNRITNLTALPGIRRILSFDVSPDEKDIVYAMFGEEEYGISLWIVGMDGSDPKLLVKYAKNPSWSPDGTKIVYTSNYLPSKEKISELEEIFLYDLNTKLVTRVTNNKWEDADPVFSPDGTKIAFKSARHREIAHGSELFVINIDGTNERQITPSKPNLKYPNDPMRGWATDEYPDWTK